MNANLFRLVFSTKLGIYVPAHEAAKSRGKASGAARPAAGLAAVLATGLWAYPVLAQLPVPCGGGACGVNPNPTAFVTSGAASYAVNGTQGIVTQTTSKAILNWQNFNIGQGHGVEFIQPGANAAALNRIWQGDASVIAGALKSNGHIYLLNQNGVLFANGAQVNVGSLTASSLDMTDARFTEGILADLDRPAVFTGTTGFVRVEAGASLTAASGGRIMLLAPEVENAGLIQTPDGQTILAAGQKIYLNDTLDPAGVVVEVDSGGTATNLGEIIARRGNVSLVGLAVNQMGRITATTSVRAGGSIFLRARDTVNTSLKDGAADPDGDGNQEEKTLNPTRTGTVILSKDSITQVLPEVDDKEEILDQQAFSPSRIEIQGGTVDIEGTLRAWGGNVEVSAVLDPRAIGGDGAYKVAYGNYGGGGAHIYLGESALIDVSGLEEVAMAMEDHQLSVKLYSEQLKDAPLLRGGPLFGQVVYLDAREGSPLFDYSAAAALNGRSVAEKSTVGGNISLKSEGDVVARQGSLLDVSGGSLKYASGYIKTSKLTYQGQLTDISEASADVPYDGLSDVYTAKDPKWGVIQSWTLGVGVPGTYHEGYVQGMDAGGVTVWAPAGFVLNGEMRARTTAGDFQRDAPPKGGAFNLGVSTPVAPAQYLAPVMVRIAREQALLPADFALGDALPLDQANRVAMDSLAPDFDRITVASDQDMDVEASMDVGAGGKVHLVAASLEVNADIRAPGGSITLEGGDITVAPGRILGAAGLWTNDSPYLSGAMTAPVALDGGKVEIKGTGVVEIGVDTLVDVSAGAWRAADGRTATGAAGRITINALDLTMEGELAGYGFGEGGDLTITVNQDVRIGGDDPAGGWFWLPGDFFQRGGFSSFEVASPRLNNGRFIIGDGSPMDITAQAASYVLPLDVGLNENAASLHGIASTAYLPEYLSSPVDLSFAAAAGGEIGSLVVAAGTTLRTGVGGDISLKAGDQLQVLGGVEARAGNISLTLSSDTSTYDASRAIWVGGNARLIANGYFTRSPDDGSGLKQGELLHGGNIHASAEKGYLVVEQGALLDVSGTTAQVDVLTDAGFVMKNLASDGGGIDLSAREGLLLDGDFKGMAGGPDAAGGRLAVALTGRDPGVPNDFQLPVGGRVLTVSQTFAPSAAGLAPGDALETATYNGQARISADQISAGGFHDLSLASHLTSRKTQTGQDKVALSAGLNLSLPGSITIDTPLVEVHGNGDAVLRAPYVRLTNNSGQAVPGAAVVATAGNGLSVQADWMDLVGQLAIGGVDTVTMNSMLDIRARGLLPSLNANGGNTVNGWLLTAGDLTMAARQVYPASTSDFRVEVLGNGATLTIQRARSNGATVADIPVLSAGGGLFLKADNIVQAGVVKAPLGEIVLEAKDKLSLPEGSITSVSAEGQIIPYGTSVLGGRHWKQLGGLVDVNAPREKRISLTADAVSVDAGATLDVSGGGDLMAYEWIDGIYGSGDLLGEQGVYAVLPDQKSGYAPFDWDYGKGGDPRPGDAVYLAGVDGLEAGYYTLLPARYALLPGAMLIQPQAGTDDMQSSRNSILADGSRLVAGYRSNLADGSRDARTSGFKVTSGDIFRQSEGQIYKGPSEYTLTYANTYFPAVAAGKEVATPRLPEDAGHLVADARAQLKLRGELLAQTGDTGKGALVDIVSSEIRVVSALGPDDGSLQLEADALTALGVESLLLGGTRQWSEDGVRIATSAQKVSFDNDATHPLGGEEILAVASDSLTVSEKATLIATHQEGTVPAEQQPLLLSGDGALVRLSGLGDAAILRTGATSIGGDLTIGKDALLKASRALALDATRNFDYAGRVELDGAGAAYFGASRISLGTPASRVQGILFSSDDLAALGNLARLTLSSNSTLDLYGGLDFGNGDLELIVQAGGIAGYGNAGRTATLTADKVILSNPNQRAFAQAPAIGNPGEDGYVPAPVLGDGTLSIEANRIELGRTGLTAGGQDLTVAGFNDAKLVTPGEIVAQADGQLDFLGTSATLTSGRITTASGVDYTVQGNGGMTLDRHGAALPFAAAPEGLGGRLAVIADALTVAGTVELPSGAITLKSTGANQNLTLTGDARVLAKGSATRFDGRDYYTPGGSVTLVSDAGNVIVAATIPENGADTGQGIDVSSRGGDAGLVDIHAGNKVVIASGAKLKAEAGGEGLGGRFFLDTANANSATTDENGNAVTGNDFSGLNTVLEAGGFRGERQIRLRDGDVEIAAGDRVRTGRFVLTAEVGTVVVKGKVDAGGTQAGDIAIHAGNNVTLYKDASLDVGATGQGEAGGRVFLSSEHGFLDLEAGSSVNVSGGAGGRDGLLHLRARRMDGGDADTLDNDEVAVSNLKSTISGAEAIRLEGYKTYSTTSMSGTYLTTGAVNADTTGFMSKLAAIRARLGMDGNAAFRLTPGIEVRSAADLTIAADTTLHALRYDPDTGAVAPAGQLASGMNNDGKALLAGVLTLRAPGDLNINGSLSDGFSTALASTGVVQGLESWSYRLVAGADTSSANPLGLLPSASLAANKGHFKVANSKLIRTGTGDIAIAAARNMSLGNDSSAIYTAGRAAGAVDGFSAPTTNLKPLYLTDGGDIDIRVGGDIEGKVSAAGGGQQLVTNWLFRQGGGSSGLDVTWWVRPDLFKQNLGALGGGDIRIEAGGDVKNFSAVIPTTGRVPNDDPDQLVVSGGGDLLVRAGRDILSGVYLVGQGEGHLIAGGRIDDADGNRGEGKSNTNFGTTLAVQDGRFMVRAGGDAFIETVFNPTLWAQVTANALSINPTGLASYFSTYGEDSGLSLQSVHGDAIYGSMDKDTLLNKVRTGTNANALFNYDSLFIQPGSVRVVSHQGDVRVSQLTLWPDADGTLELMAGGDLLLAYQEPQYSGIHMSDADLSQLPTLGNPMLGLKLSGSQGVLSILRNEHALRPVHLGDAEPVRLVARQGSITYTFDKGSTTSVNPGAYSVMLPKQAHVVAGLDILGLDLSAQHLGPGDMTYPVAGRDVGFGASAGGGELIQVSGPGELLIQASRHIDLARSGGVVSTANTTNPVLDAENGSNITLLAGLGSQGAAIGRYVDQYIDPDGSGPAALADDPDGLASYRQKTLETLTAYMKRVAGAADPAPGDVLAWFLALDTARQAPFIHRHFSSELLSAGQAAASGEGYDRGYDAIAVLFPGPGYAGDLSLYNSQVKTVHGASIDILVPGGIVNAGLPGSSTGSEVGIVTERGGAIRSFSDQGFLVNQSKVITQYASDITVWVSNGDIDAGRGSQTAVSVPRKAVTTDADGYTSIEYKGAATGSGIRAQTYDPDGPNGPEPAPSIKDVNVALLAPRGILNAGEAGIEAGNLLVVAQLVLGQENIKVEGAATGVSLDTSSIAAPPPPNLSDAGKVSEEATKSLSSTSNKAGEEQARMKESLASFKPSFISVEVLGFGDGTSSLGGDVDETERRRREEESRRRDAQGA